MNLKVLEIKKSKEKENIVVVNLSSKGHNFIVFPFTFRFCRKKCSVVLVELIYYDT